MANIGSSIGSARTRVPWLLIWALSVVLLGTVGVEGAAAQATGTVRGTVVASATGEPIQGVSITASGTTVGTITDPRGRYTLDLPAGRFELRASRVGYRAETQSVTISAGSSVEVGFTLSESAVLLPSVVVSATREAQRLSQTAASVGVVSADELENSKPSHPSEVMGKIPGVWVSQTGGEGHMTAIRQPKTTGPVYLFLEDGVPTRSTGFFNHNALYEVNLPQAERVEVMKGPSSSALYGSDAIGGVVNVETSRPSLEPAAEAFLEGGSFGWTRALLSASGTRGADGFRADVNITDSDGWREGTAYERQSGTIRWDRSFDDGSTLKTVLTGSLIDQQTAGSSALQRDDYLENPTLNYTPISLRNVRAVRFSAAWEKQTDNSLFSVTPFARWNDMELLPNWALTYDPTIYTTGHSSLGVLARMRHDLDDLNTRVITGIDVDYSPGSRLEHSIAPARNGNIFTSYERVDRIYDYDVTFRGISPFVQIEASPLEQLHLHAGLRYDHLGYDYDNKLTAIATGPHRRPESTDVSFDHLSPKLGIAYEFGTGLNAFASYSHGFRAPSESQLFRQGSSINTIELDPVRADNYEIGLRGELFQRVGYTAAAYYMRVKDDILTFIHPDGTRETQNAGETLHRGFELGLGVALLDDLRADVSLSIARHHYGDWQPQPNVDLTDNEMPDAPRRVARVGLAYDPDFLRGARLSIDWSSIGEYWMDDANTHRYDGHSLVNLNATIPVGNDLEIIGRVINLTDERYAESASYTQFRGEEFAPGLPRAIYLGLQYRWGAR